MAPAAATPAWIHINDPAISGQIPGPSREPAPGSGGPAAPARQLPALTPAGARRPAARR